HARHDRRQAQCHDQPRARGGGDATHAVEHGRRVWPQFAPGIRGIPRRRAREMGGGGPLCRHQDRLKFCVAAPAAGGQKTVGAGGQKRPWLPGRAWPMVGMVPMPTPTLLEAHERFAAALDELRRNYVTEFELWLKTALGDNPDSAQKQAPERSAMGRKLFAEE